MDRLKLLQVLRRLEQEFQLVRDIPADQECYAFSSTFMLEIVRNEMGAGSQRAGGNGGPSKIARELHARIAAVLQHRKPRTAQLSFAIAEHYFDAGQSHAAQAVEHCLAAARIAREPSRIPWTIVLMGVTSAYEPDPPAATPLTTVIVLP
jgi:hypothetical protein